MMAAIMKFLLGNVFAINSPIVSSSPASIIARVFFIFPAASGLFLFSGCCLSFSKSIMSLIM